MSSLNRIGVGIARALLLLAICAPTNADLPPENDDEARDPAPVSPDTESTQQSLGSLVNPVPSFALSLQNRPMRQYTTPAFAEGAVRYYYDGNYLAATLTDLGQGRWRLTFPTSFAIPILDVWFPFEPSPTTLNADTSDDVIYYPNLAGLALQSESLPESQGIQGLRYLGTYPGGVFSPLVIIADSTKARMAASTTWPPKSVRPVYARNRIGLRFDQDIPARAGATYEVLYQTYNSDTENGDAPWQLGLDDYRNWLTPQMRNEQLNTNYPDWLKNAHGWLNFQLQNSPDELWLETATQLWEQSKSFLPWMQFWGQMNPFGGDCCNQARDLAPRYAEDLLNLARRVRSEGGQVGYYSRPRQVNGVYGSLTDPTVVDGQTNLQWLDTWLTNQQAWFAGAFYIDTLGARPYGDPLSVAKLFASHWAEGTVIEWFTDIYPTAYLLSGALWGREGFYGQPGLALKAGDPQTLRSPDMFGESVYAKGITAEYYRTALPVPFTAMPNFNAFTPDYTRTETQLAFGPIDGEWLDTSGEPVSGYIDDFAIRFSGELRIPVGGQYGFTLRSDELSVLLIDGRVISVHDGHGLPRTSRNTVDLSVGFHSFELRHIERTGPAELSLTWQPSFRNGAGEILTQHYLVHQEVVRSCAFPRMGRYLLNDRVVFEGVSNGDHYLWGYGYDRNYFTERQAFLLGAKLDAPYLEDRKALGHPEEPLDPTAVNPMVRQILEERERTHWWNREPTYWDTKGIALLSHGFEVRRFVDKEGGDMLVIDNWEERPVLMVQLNGRVLDITIPIDPETGRAKKLYIGDLVAEAPKVVSSSPQSGFIDPLEDVNAVTGQSEGLRVVRLTFDRQVVSATNGGNVELDDWSVSETGGRAPPQVSWVRQEGESTYMLVLNRPITPGQWTSIRPLVAGASGVEIQMLSGNRIDLGFLPGDVSANGAVTALDLGLWQQYDNDGAAPPQSMDLDRDGHVGRLDERRWNSLATGLNSTRAWLGTVLPPLE